jgi:hypothetical protein
LRALIRLRPGKRREQEKITIPNPSYDTWIVKDQMVVSFLVNSLSDDVLSHVFGLQHAGEKALTDLYIMQSKSRLSYLCGALTNTKKQD